MANIADTDILGTIDSNGVLAAYTNKEALQNSIKLWITSFSNDALRNPNRGGYVTQQLYKPMTESSQQSITDALIDGFNTDYTPYVKVLNLDVVPNYQEKTWEISVAVYSDLIKDTAITTTTIKNFV